jgi:hypothetical protein
MSHLLRRVRSFATAAFLAATVLWPVGPAHAHMLLTQERDVGDVRVLMAFFADGAFAGDLLGLMFGLAKLPGGEEPIPFDEVAVAVVPKDGGKTFENVIEPEDNVAYLDHAFPKAGDYDIKLSFKRGAEKPIEATFLFKVVENPFAAPERNIIDRMLGVFGR